MNTAPTPSHCHQMLNEGLSPTTWADCQDPRHKVSTFPGAPLAGLALQVLQTTAVRVRGANNQVLNVPRRERARLKHSTSNSTLWTGENVMGGPEDVGCCSASMMRLAAVRQSETWEWTSRIVVCGQPSSAEPCAFYCRCPNMVAKSALANMIFDDKELMGEARSLAHIQAASTASRGRCSHEWLRAQGKSLETCLKAVN